MDFKYADIGLTREGREARAKLCRTQIHMLSKEANEIYATIEALRRELVELRRLHDMEGYDGNEL